MDLNESKPSNDEPWISLVQDGADIAAEKSPSVVEVVAGVVAERAKLLIGGGSKTFKTWLAMDLALSVAHGVTCLARRTTRHRVLYVNLELKAQTFSRRLQGVAKAKGITIDREWFFHLALRGKLAQAGGKVCEIVNRVIAVAQHWKVGVVVIDPIYKLNLEGDENSSHVQTLLFNELDRITTQANCTLILIDHFSKGNQSEKDPLDAIRGSSAKVGDVDAVMVLRRHEVEDCFRVDLVHRELPPVKAFCIGWKLPLMEVRPDLDPCAPRSVNRSRRTL